MTSEPGTRSLLQTAPAPRDLASLDLASRANLNLPADQRRTTISVRLTEEESAQLRSRAAESGISVSAYMRSCVVDAEHLRTQVKQALSEMRASLRSSEPVTPMQLPTQSGAFPGGAWFRVITRTAALFLASLFSLRHRA